MADSDKFNVHPVLNNAEADVVLSSIQGTQFRLHSFTLKETSGYFHSILSNTYNPISGSELFTQTLQYSDAPLERVLLMISGLSTTPWTSFSELEDAVAVMEYLDTPGPLSLVRASCLTPILLQSPIGIYGLGEKFGWDEVSQHAAELTLPMGNLVQRALSDHDVDQQLKKVGPAALMRLLAFHQRRRDRFRTLLYSNKFPGGNTEPGYCVCGAKRDNSSWQCFQLRLLIEMERDTSGAWIRGREMQEWGETKKCWDAKCLKSGCGALNYNPQMTMRGLDECIRELPTSI